MNNSQNSDNFVEQLLFSCSS